MNRLTLIIWMVALVTVCHLQGTAQELVTPPPGLPQERWELGYDDYRAPLRTDFYGYWMLDRGPDYPSIPPLENLVNLKRIVVMARYGNDVYIQGVFEAYPDAWIKGTVNGDRLMIGNNQPIDAYGPVYFHMGSWSYDVLNYLDYRTISSSISLTSGDDLISFVISDDGNTIVANTPSEYDKPAFWYDNDPTGDWVFDYNLHYEADDEGSGCPDIPYMINMVFKRIE